MNTIIFPVKRRMKNVAVANLQDALMQLLERGALFANDEASRRELAPALQRERAQQTYGTATAKLVSRFQEERQLQGTGEVNESTAGRLNDELTKLFSVPEFMVSGTVLFPEGKPFVDGKIHAYDKDLRSEELLGEDTTDKSGRYKISYHAGQFHRSEKDKADLVVRAFDARGRELAISPVLFNAGPTETVDLIIGNKAFRGLSEYEQLVAEIEPLLKGQDVTIADLTEDAKHQDISFLSGETGRDAQHLMQLAEAHRLAKARELAPDFLYGIFRKGLSTDLAALVYESSDSLRGALESASQDNLMPAASADAIETFIQRLRGMEVKQPDFLAGEELFYRPLTELERMSQEETAFFNQRLNASFRHELRNALGALSKAMNRALLSIAEQLDYRSFKDADLAVVIREGLFPELKKNIRLAEEVAELEERVRDIPAQTVSEILHLNVPLKANPIFTADVHRVKTLKYAELSGLDSTSEAARTLVERNLLLTGGNATILAELVKEGIIDEPQKKALHVTLELGKLTGDNFSLVERLKKTITSPSDMVGWDENEWIELIEDARLFLPPGDTVESYAKNLRLNLERTYPSQALLRRVASNGMAGKIALLDELNPLLDTNDQLLNGTRLAPIDSLDETKQKALENLASFTNTYRYLGITELVNNKEISLEDKKGAIEVRLSLLKTFTQNNPDMDLRFISLAKKKGDSGLSWNGISEEDRPLLKRQLMAYQRALVLANDADDRQRLLEKGYDSALAIVSETEAGFINTSGLAGNKARLVYANAQEHALSVALSYAGIREVVKGDFSKLAVANLPPSLTNDLADLDGYDTLFGSQDYCDCEHCRSIFSPAAYFADLMRFIEQYVTEPVFIKKGRADHPLSLKNRRKDLWTLPLSCENTHTEIPYLTLVNEVLESYLKQVLSTDDVDRRLAAYSPNNPAAQSSFGLPFNLPLAKLRLYLSHFKLTLHEIYHVLREPDEKTWRARLDLSKEELDVIAHKQPNGIRYRYGNPSTLSNYSIQEFIRRAGIERDQLDELLKLRFYPGLNAIKVERLADPIEPKRFKEVLQHLTDDHLDFIHRFIRIWRKTSWGISELDLVLTALKQAGLCGEDVDEKGVLNLARLVELQGELKFTVEELCPLVDEFPASRAFPRPPIKQADRRLYERLFDLTKLFMVKNASTRELETEFEFHHYSLNKNNSNDRRIDPKTPHLLAGLGITETELLLLFDLLQKKMPFDAVGDTRLDKKKLSDLYRHARLAKALRLSVADFIQALHLNFDSDKLVITTIEQILKLRTFNEWLKASPFTVSELRFILKGEESPAVRHQNDLKTAAKCVQEVQAVIENAATTLEPGEKIDILKARLMASFNLSALALDNVLAWVDINITGSDFQTALDTTFTDGEPDNFDDLSALLALMKEIERQLLLFSKLKFKDETIDYLTEKVSTVLKISDPKNLTLNDIKTLTFYRKMVAQDDDAEAAVQQLLNSYPAAGGGFPKDYAERLALLWRQDKSLIDSLIHALTPSQSPIAGLKRLWEVLDVCKELGVNGYSLAILAKDGNFNEISAARDVALGAFSSKYQDEKTRKEKLEPYQDQINVIKRDAWCDYIIARHELKFEDRNDVLAFFLIDVNMSGCARTSRVVSGISALQMYIHRVLINREKSENDEFSVLDEMPVDNLKEFKIEWEWRKNYRVWEANRKVFLYPENYLEPDLRDNKTPIFRELEDELLQQKITKEAAEAAYRKYVPQFAELARLRIAGSYYHAETNTYYFFGRTQQDPPQYYYRKWVNNKEWTSWEKIELGINAPHVSATIYKGKIFIFWVEMTIQEKTRVQNGSSYFDGYEYQPKFIFSYLNEAPRYFKWVA